MHVPGPWIPGFDAARCGQCGGIFSIRDGQCPKGDGGTEGWSPVNSTRARAEIRRLRWVIDTIKGALVQIARGTHSTEFKTRCAQKALDYINEAAESETASAGTEAVSRKEVQSR